MIALPVQGRCAFASLHPAVTFAFFTGALLLCMVFAHPLLQVEAVCLAALCYVSFRGRGAWPFIGGLAVLLAVVAFASPLFNTQGETVLFRWWAGRPYTLEALALGASTGLMLAAMMLWFASYHLVMTSDKFTFLFGRALPGLSTVLVMVLRLVPTYRRRAEKLATARAGIGQGPSEGATMGARVRSAGTVLSALSADALEGSIITADSMVARGYGLPGRTHYALFRWGRRDSVVLAAMIGLLGATVVALLMGETAVRYFPAMVVSPLGPGMLVGALCYGLFLLLPTAINLGGRLAWRCSLSSR